MTHTPIDAEKVARRELVVARFRQIRKAKRLVCIFMPWGALIPIISEDHAIAEIEELEQAVREHNQNGAPPPKIDTVGMLASWPLSDAEHREALGQHIAGLYECMGKMRKALGVIRSIPTAR